MELILGRMKMSNALLVESLFKMDEGQLKQNVTEALVNAIPLDAEKTLWGPDVDKETLAAPDLFCIECLTVKGYDHRLNALKFKYNQADLVDDLKFKIQLTQKVLDFTSKDESINIILKYVLGIGNYMNGQSARGGAYAFKFDMVEKIAEVKSTDNKKNLMMYIVEIAEQKEGKPLMDPNENMEDYEAMAKTPIS